MFVLLSGPTALPGLAFPASPAMAAPSGGRSPHRQPSHPALAEGGFAPPSRPLRLRGLGWSWGVVRRRGGDNDQRRIRRMRGEWLGMGWGMTCDSPVGIQGARPQGTWNTDSPTPLEIQGRGMDSPRDLLLCIVVDLFMLSCCDHVFMLCSCFDVVIMLSC